MQILGCAPSPSMGQGNVVRKKDHRQMPAAWTIHSFVTLLKIGAEKYPEFERE